MDDEPKWLEGNATISRSPVAHVGDSMSKILSLVLDLAKLLSTTCAANRRTSKGQVLFIPKSSECCCYAVEGYVKLP